MSKPFLTAPKAVLIAISGMVLGIILGNQVANAQSRYAEKPPVVLSPNLTQPWLLQPGRVIRGKARYAKPEQRYSGRKLYLQPRGHTLQQRRVVAKRQPYYSGAQRIRVNPANVQRGQTKRRATRQINPIYLPQMVNYNSSHKKGTVVIDTNSRFLYLVLGNGKAKRYGVGVGRAGFEWTGTHKITRKAQWPSWTPPKEMRIRERAKGIELPVTMAGGPNNPMGARGLYLGSTLYRIHGTNQPWTIGGAVSSGCIRMRNEDVADLYDRVPVGAKVKVI